MRDLPRPLLDHLAQRAHSERDAAWFLVDPLGVVQEVGGNVVAHALDEMEAGAFAKDVAPYLQGNIEGREEHGILRRVETAPDRYSDVHLLPVEWGTWVLLLDATPEARRDAESQQKRYDLVLELEERHRRDFQEVVKALDVLVIREIRDGRYAVVGKAPAWSEPWIGGRTSFDPLDTWPFLESFLPEAHEFCGSDGRGVLRSGAWLETLDTGEEVPLEATAVRTARRGCLILVECRGERLREHQQVIQRAREHHLAHARLVKEIEKKEVLLHCIVHDLNGPLTAIMGSLELLKADPSAPESVQSLGEMGRRQSRRLERMVKNILEVYAADVGELMDETPPDPLDPSPLVRELGEEYAPSFTRKGIDFHVDVPSPCPSVRAESARFARVIANLLDNALRHTRRGAKAALRLVREDEMLALRVENEGEPVPEELRERLFDRFARSPTSGGAAGLGLFFCQITVERWGGEIAYEPLPTGGSLFRARLPLAD